MTRKSNMVPDDDILECALTVNDRVNIVVSNLLLK